MGGTYAHGARGGIGHWSTCGGHKKLTECHTAAGITLMTLDCRLSPMPFHES
jgi:hypothetical protein